MILGPGVVDERVLDQDLAGPSAGAIVRRGSSFRFRKLRGSRSFRTRTHHDYMRINDNYGSFLEKTRLLSISVCPMIILL